MSLLPPPGQVKPPPFKPGVLPCKIADFLPSGKIPPMDFYQSVHLCVHMTYPIEPSLLPFFAPPPWLPTRTIEQRQFSSVSRSLSAFLNYHPQNLLHLVSIIVAPCFIFFLDHLFATDPSPRFARILHFCLHPRRYSLWGKVFRHNCGFFDATFFFPWPPPPFFF